MRCLRVGWLIAAAALPLNPLAAQEVLTEPPPPASPPPVIDLPPPPVTQTAPPGDAESGNSESQAADPPAPAPEPAAVRTTARSTSPAPAARTAEPAAAAVPPVEEPAAEPPAEVFPQAQPVPGLVTDTLPPDTVPPEAIADEPDGPGALWPWLLAGVLLIAALAILLVRRRRAAARSYAETYEEPAAPVGTAPEPVTASTVPGAAAAAGASVLVRKVERPKVDAAEAIPTIEPPLAAELAGAPMTAAPVAAAAARGRPDLRLDVRPLRAGVQDRTASVEFELTIENRGGGPARDVGIATWIYADGTGAPSEAERTLIEHPASEIIEEIGVGQSHRLRSAAALPVGPLEADSILPVVVVDARYRRSDGKEERTTGSFAVGVPLEGELARFDLENPSGLHDTVEARALDERA